MSLDFTPSPTVERFMLDNSSVRVIVGPLGSGKSLACIVELLRRARLQEPHEGIRYSRFACIRNTSGQLRTTVLPDIQLNLGPMMTYFTTDSTVRIRAPLPDGTTIQSDWLLIPLDTKEDQRKLLSLPLTGAWINEVREVPFDIIKPLRGRLGRYPPKRMGGCTWRGLICDTNPWDEDSEYHDALVLNPRNNWKLFHQPSGIGPYAENVDNLPDGYYDELMDGKTSEWSDVHVESQFGVSNAGQAVFRTSFHAPDHVHDMKVAVNPHRPLIVGVDFGRTPCAIICQTDNMGRLLVLQEVVTAGMGIIQMVEEHLKPVLLGPPYNGTRVIAVGDPSGNFKGQITEETPFDAMRTAGLAAYPASTNSIEPRLRALEKLFLGRVAGQSAIQINRAGCPTLVQALGSKYRYRKKRDGELEDLPEKSHPWSDIVDGLQYAALGVQMNLVGRMLRREARQAAPPQMVSAAGWT